MVITIIMLLIMGAIMWLFGEVCFYYSIRNSKLPLEEKKKLFVTLSKKLGKIVLLELIVGIAITIIIF